MLSRYRAERWIPARVGPRDGALPWQLGAGSVLAGCVAVALAAHLRVPVPGTDVPMTMQPLVVLLVGFSLPPARAASSLALYLAVGLAGLPVFAGSVGLLGPTGGYLLGFVGAAALVSALRNRGNGGTLRLLAAGAAGMAVIFAAGSVWRLMLAMWLAEHYDARWDAALLGDIVPFLPKAVIDVLLATGLAASVRRWRPAA